MKSIQFKRNLTIIITTACAVALFYILYTQVYTKNREDQLIQTRFRALDQMGENLKAKVDSYKKNAETLADQLFNSEQNESADYKKSALESVDIKNIILKLNEFENKDAELLTDALVKALNDLNVNKSNITTCDLESALEKTGYLYEEHVKVLAQKVLDSLNNARLKPSDYSKEYILKRLSELNKFFNEDLLFSKINIAQNIEPFSIKKDTIFFISDSLEFYLPNEILFKNLDYAQAFEKLLFIADSSILYSSFHGDLKLVYTNVANDRKKSKGLLFNREKRNDTLFLPSQGIMRASTILGNRCYDIFLADGPYKLFLQPVKLDKEECYLVGLNKLENFQRANKGIAPWIIIILSVVLLEVILSLPFIKLKAMSGTEMLGPGTVIYAGLSLFIGAAFLTFYLFFQAHYFTRIQETDKQLKDLSDEVSKTLKIEMDSVYKQLIKSDKQFNEDSNNITNVLLKSINWYTKSYSYFDYIFWLDSSGQQITQISPFSEKEKLINLSGRDYFKKKDEWPWKEEKPDGYNKFRMESIVSVKSSDYKVAFSMPSNGRTNKNQLVIAMTGRFYSLIDPILPKDFKFCIIDETGKVWFHSNKHHNLAENFFNECNDDLRIAAAMYANGEKKLYARYYNDPHRIYINPIAGLPLFLVTMYDLKTENSFQAQVFITTLVLISGMFGFLILQVIIFLMITHFVIKKKHNGKFNIDFLKLKQSKATDYKYLILILAIMLLFVSTFISQMPDLVFLFACFLLVILFFSILLFNFKNYSNRTWGLVLYILLNIMLLIALKLFFFQEVKIIHEIETGWTNPLISFSLMICLFLLFRQTYYKLQDKPEVGYSIVFFLILLLFSVIPILKFYNAAVNLENKVNIRYGQVEIAKAKEARNEEYHTYYKRFSTDSVTDTNYKARNKCGIYIDFWYNTKLTDSLPLNKAIDSKKPALIDPFLYPLRPVYRDKYSYETKFLLQDSSFHQKYQWKSSGKDSPQLLYYRSRSENLGGYIPDSMCISSKLPKVNILENHWTGNNRKDFLVNVLLLALFLGVILLFYLLILFSTRSIFGASLLKDQANPGLIISINEHLDLGKSVILVNSSGLLNYQWVEQKLKTDISANAFHWIDPDGIEMNEVWLVNDLLKDYRDPKAFGEKLTTLMRWLTTSERLIILLETHPEKIMNFFKENEERNKDKDPKANKIPNDKSEPFRQAGNLFGDLVKMMTVMHIPLKYNYKSEEFDQKQAKALFEEKDLEKPDVLIPNEFMVSDYLSGLQSIADKYLADLKNRKPPVTEKIELIRIRIREITDKYYQSLLETCSGEEKFVLLDMASDNISNIRNKKIILKLMRRGILIKKKDSVEIMNSSFRDYILSAYSKSEKQQFKKSIDTGHGDWSAIRYAILIVIGALFVFIFLSNQEFLNNLNKLFITLAASVAGISSLFNLVKKKGSESSS